MFSDVLSEEQENESFVLVLYMSVILEIIW